MKASRNGAELKEVWTLGPDEIVLLSGKMEPQRSRACGQAPLEVELAPHQVLEDRHPVRELVAVVESPAPYLRH